MLTAILIKCKTPEYSTAICPETALDVLAVVINVFSASDLELGDLERAFRTGILIL